MITNKYVTYTPEGKILLPNVKKIFIPDEGYEICDVDLSGADIQVVAADSGCKWLLDFFSKEQDKKVYAYIASEFFQRDISDKSDEYKTYKGIFHGCVTEGHEILTRKGWIDIADYDGTEEITVWDRVTNKIFFENPKGFNKDFVEPNEFLYSVEGRAISFLGTQDHKFPYITSPKHGIKTDEIQNLPFSAQIPYTGEYIGGAIHLDNNFIRLLVAFQADGTIESIDAEGRGTFYFQFHKKRKIDRLVEILSKLNVHYKLSNLTRIVENKVYNYTNIWFKGVLDPYMKKLDWWILNYSRENISFYIEELPHWDGHIRLKAGKQVTVSSTDFKAVEIMQTLIQFSNKGSVVSKVDKSHLLNNKDVYEVSISGNQYAHLRKCTRKLIKHKGTNVYCPQTSTGYFMCRRNGNIYVSGNTNYLMGIEKLAKMAGISYNLAKSLQDFYFYLNPEIRVWHKRLEHDVKTTGFVRNKFGRRMQFFITRDNPTVMNEVAAAIPQSTIGDVINRAWVNLIKNLPEIQILMQTHDSLTNQYPIEVAEQYRKDILKYMEVPIPYDPPLIIGSDIKVSRSSYGDCVHPRKLKV